MISIDFSDGVCSPIFEKSVKVFNLLCPISMRAQLALWKHEGFTGIEDAIYCVQVCIISCYFEDPGQAEEVERCSARLEDKAMGGYEERGFAAVRCGAEKGTIA
jgi:hypothetical protein